MGRGRSIRAPGRKRAWLYALLLHVVLLGLLVVSFRWSKTSVFAPSTSQPIVQATALPDPAARQEVERLKQEQLKRDREAERKRLEEERRRRDAEAEAEKQRRAEEAKKAEAERQRQKAEEAKKAEAQKRLDEAKKAEERKLKEQAKQADDKKRRDEAKKAEDKKRKEQEQLAQAARKQEAEQRRRDSERALQEQLAREERERSRQAQAASASATEIARYEALIRQKVERNWTRPAQFDKGLECTIRVRTVSSGEVVSAVVVRSSGQPAFDRSAEAAVRKATPLPVPEDQELFAHFREFDFIFRPEV